MWQGCQPYAPAISLGSSNEHKDTVQPEGLSHEKSGVISHFFFK
jgi:hypothetical protein